MDLRNRIALVTGAGRRVGRAIATALGARGMHVAVHYNGSAEGAREAAADIQRAGGNATLFQSDLSRPSAPAALVDEVAHTLGGLDVLVNSAAIMPGKINPSIPEMVNQVCFQVIGCDTTVAIAAEHGQLELNVMMPVIGHNVLLSMKILSNAGIVLAEKTIKGIKANEAMCSYWVERSAALATALMPHIGYARAAEISKQSVKEGVLIRDLVKRDKVLPDDQIDEVLDLRKMTEIGVPGGTHSVSAGG